MPQVHEANLLLLHNLEQNPDLLCRANESRLDFAYNDCVEGAANPVVYRIDVRLTAMEKRIYSISFRLRRTKVEYAYVSVPVDQNILEPDPENAAQMKVNAQKVVEVAKRMATQPGILWAQEGEPLIEPHPWQTPPPRS